MQSIYEIKEEIRRGGTHVELLEKENVAKDRFERGNTVLFLAGDDKVLKFFSLKNLEENDRENTFTSINREYLTLRSLPHHPGVVKAFDIQQVYDEEGITGVYIIFEKFDTTLRELMHKGRSFVESEVFDFLNQMNAALEFIHFYNTNPIIHSDIKPSNIGIRYLEDRSIQYSLMDFGVAVYSDNNTTSVHNLIKGFTPAYSAPEQIKAYNNSNGNITSKVDIYSVGVIALEMITGIPPRKNKDSIYYEIPLIAAPANFRNIISILCNPETNNRPDKIEKALHFIESEVYGIANASSLPETQTQIKFEASRNESITHVKRVMLITVSVVLSFIVLFIIFQLHSNNLPTSNNTGFTQQDIQDGESFNDDDVIDLTNQNSGSYNITNSGLRYRVLREGSGNRPFPHSTIEMHYVFTLPSGEVIENTHGERPLRISLRDLSDEIPGLSEGLQLMREGGVYEFSIPEYLSFIDEQEEVMFRIDLMRVY